MALTHKNLFQLVNTEINKKLVFNTNASFDEQLNKPVSVQPFSIGSETNSDISTVEVVSAVQTLLNEALPGRIISGLAVTATDPVTDQVVISTGKGTIGGNLYELTEATTITIPFDNQTNEFFISLKDNAINIDVLDDPNKLVIALIVVPAPGATDVVRDKDNGSFDAYIQQRQEVKFFGDTNGNLEEDSMEIFRENIGEVLASTIVGTITLNQNLRIVNTQGTVELDSKSVLIRDESNNVLSKFNKDGIFFFDNTGIELAKFSTTGARIGNIVIQPNALESDNFVSGSTGFQIKDSGDVEFNNLEVRGTVHATDGSIGGFTITPTKLFGGQIQTAENVASGSTGVVMDTQGLRGFDAVLGQTFNLPTDGSAPTFSSGIIKSTIFEINTNAIMRTSETVGDGSADSAGVLINNTGIYATEANQTLADANLKALIDGSIKIKGTIIATAGQIGNVTITSDKLTGGLIEGSTIRGAVIETQAGTPKIRMDSTGLFYQVTTTIGKYGPSSSGNLGFMYGDGTKYGSGLSAVLFNTNFPVLSILSLQTTTADIRLFDRTTDPIAGSHEFGDLITVAGKLKQCTTEGSPGTFTAFSMEERNVLAINSDQTLDETHYIVIADTTGGPITVTLPPAPTVPGRDYRIKNIGSGGNTLTIDAASGETIENTATKTSTTQYESFDCVSDGSEWWIMGSN